jgi:peptide/nickel transport system substrate-binding protein
VGRIEMLQIKDPTSRLQAFTSEAIDIAFALSPDDATEVEAIGGRIVSRPAPLINFLLFVTTLDTPLRDVRVRRALNHAANKSQLLKAFVADAVSPATQFSHPMAFGFDPSLQPYAYDPERARTLLSEAGYPDGFAFSMLLVPESGSSYADWFQQLAQDFSAVGVSMTVQAATTARIIESVQTGNWPTEAFAWTFAGFDSLRGYRFRSCGWTAPYHCDPAMMPLIEAAQTADTKIARLSATRAALAHERDNPPGVLLWQGVGFDGLASTVTDFVVENDFVRWDLVRLKDSFR